MGKLFYIMGKSASGKDKIYGRLLERAELGLKKLVLYTTRPIRVGEEDGKQYFFVDERQLEKFQENGQIIELRSYHTVHGIWSYFTVNDGQMDLQQDSYLGIGTLESYEKLLKFYGGEVICPIYIEVEDGERLTRALIREQKQEHPKYAELCRRFLADTEDFSEENIQKAGIVRRFANVDLEQCLSEIENYIKVTK